MNGLMTAKQAAEKWNITQRQVLKLCKENRIEGADRLGFMWTIPADAEKPIDKRTIRYVKEGKVELKPFIKWAGGKTQLLPEIQKFIPDSGDKVLTKYAEPMVGGGALLFNVLSKYDFEELYISDINPELINCYQVIKSDVERLISKLLTLQTEFLSYNTEKRKLFYYNIRTRFNTLQLNNKTSCEKASLFIFLNKTCFNGLYRVNKKGEYNVPMGDYKNPKICDEETLRADSAVLQRVEILCGDFAQTGKYAHDNVLFYFDPPYRPLTDTSAFTSYAKEGFDDAEQIRLRDFCALIAKQKSLFVASNSDPLNVDNEDDFFDHLYKMFSIKRVSAARMINSKGNGRGAISEIMISNVANAY